MPCQPIPEDGRAASAAVLDADFERSYPDLVRYLSRHTRQGDQASDLVHDTWLRLAGSPDPQARNVRAYLFGAARHMAIDHARRDRQHTELLADAALRQTPHAPDVAERVSHRQALQAVAQALQALPERTRDAFLAHRLEGAGHDELAQRHGVTRSTIERDIQRAQAQAQAAIERWHGGAPAQHRVRRRSLAMLLGVAGLALGGPGLWQVWRSQVPTWQQALATPARRIARYTLPDGSLLTLDADSAIGVAYFGDRRALRLRRGAAFFEVTHDSARPFTVQAGPAEATVLGTRFGLELQGDPAHPRAQVEVESGRVRVQPVRGMAMELGAGESLQVDPDGHARPQPAQSGSTVAPWRTGWLSFSRTPLAEAVERLGRYRMRPLQVAPEVAGLLVSGEVQIARADEWLHLLPRMLPVRVGARPDGSLALLPR